VLRVSSWRRERLGREQGRLPQERLRATGIVTHSFIRSPVARIEGLAGSSGDELVDALPRQLHDEFAFGEHREELAVDLQPRGAELPSLAG